MTEDRIIEAVNACQEILKHYTGPLVAERNEDARSSYEQTKHVAWMLSEISYMVKVGSKEKAMRWLGFVQGYLWTKEMASIERLKEMNRPKGSEI